MTLAEDKVKIIVEGEDKASGTFKKVGGSLGKLGGIASGVLTAGLGAAAGAVGGLTAAVASTIPLTAEYESSLADLQIASKSSGLSLQELDDISLTVGGDADLLGVSAAGAAQSLTGLYKAGLDTTEIFGDVQGYMEGTADLGGALRGAIDLAAASELNMVQASDLAATNLATFGAELGSASERADFATSSLDFMVRAADASVAEVSGLAQALTTVGPTATSAGIGFEDVNTALAILSTRGIEGAEAGTALKSMIANMRRDTKKTKEAWADLGVSLYDSEGVMKSLPTLMGEMNLAMEGMTDEQKALTVQQIAGTYGMNAMNTLLAEGEEGWGDMTDAIGDATGIQEQATIKADTFEGKMEALGGVLETLRINIGKQFLPILTDLAEWFAGFVEQHGPRIVNVMGLIGETIGGIIEVVQGLFEGTIGLDTPWEDIFPPEVANIAYQISDAIKNIRDAIFPLIEAVRPFVQDIVNWVQQNIELKDVLIALGILIASVVIPAIAPLIGTVLAAGAVIAGLILIVNRVRTAWEEDWLGIRTKLTEAWEGTIKPALQDLWNWLQVNVPQAIETLKRFWEETLLPAITRVWEWVQTNLIPMFINVRDWLATNIPAAIETVSDFWENTLKPALETVWDFLNEYIVPILEGLVDVQFATLNTIVTIAGHVWRNVLLPAIKAVWGWFKTYVIPILEDVWEWLKDKLTPAVETARDWWDNLSDSLSGVKDLLSDVADWLGRVADKIASIPDHLPGWLTRGSPTPFELSLAGISEGLQAVNADLYRFNTLTNVSGFPQQQQYRFGQGQGTGSQAGPVEYHLHSYNAGTDVENDFDLMRSIAGV